MFNEEVPIVDCPTACAAGTYAFSCPEDDEFGTTVICCPSAARSGSGSSSGSGTGTSSGSGSGSDAGSGSGSSSGSGSGSGLDIGCAPGERYTIETPGSSACAEDGSGLVKDNATGLTWMVSAYYPSLCPPTGPCQDQAQAAAYCSGVGMRLPTEAEALAISGSNYWSCAGYCGWQTWTSSSAGSGLAWYVYNNGEADALAVALQSYYVLCVR